MENAAPSKPPARGGHAARALRRVARWALKIFLVVTIVSLTFNALSTPARTTSAPAGQDVEVNGARVHYQLWGGAGSPIVLVHGFFESSVAWEQTAQHLAQHHRVYAVDLAGAGYSQYTGHYSLEDQTALVSGFIARMGLGRAALVGHSLGAAVVGSVALHHADQVSAVVFADGDALPFQGGGSSSGGRQVLSGVLRTPYATSLYRAGTRWGWLDRRIFESECGSRCLGLSDQLIEAWMRPVRQGDAEEAFREVARHEMLHLTPEQVRAIRVPRGIVWGGEDDAAGGSLAGARANLDNPPTVVMPGAGHLSMVSDPKAFADAVLTVLRQASPQGGF